ncbi:unnamed protein product [Caretta caretta]
MDQKREDVTELQDNEWLQDLAFMADITEYLNSLNIRMYRCNQVVIEYYDNICAFAIKLQLWEKQLSQCNLAHFPILKSLCETTGTQREKVTERYVGKIDELRKEFQERFSDFRNHVEEFPVFSTPFSVNVHDVPEEHQMELTELQSNILLKGKLSDIGVRKFYQYLRSTYPKLKFVALITLPMFRSTYLCEQIFSIININRSKLHSQLSDSLSPVICSKC